MMHTPINVITVEREYGSRGGEFAHELAGRLGWRLLDSELVTAAARIAGVAPELAAKFDERLDPWYYRYGKVFWQDSVFPMTGISDEQVFDSERMLSLIRQEIVDAAKVGQLRAGGPRRSLRSGLSAGLFPCLCVRHGQEPSATGSRMPFPTRHSTPTNSWPHSTSVAPSSFASFTSRIGVPGGSTTCF